MFVIGIISSLLATIALLLSVYSMFQLHKLGKLNKDFWHTKGLKTLSLYIFWILLLIGGVLLSQGNEVGVPIFITALIVIMIHTTIKMILSLLVYLQFSRAEERPESEEIGLSNGLKKAFQVNLIGCLVIGGIAAFLIMQII